MGQLTEDGRTRQNTVPCPLKAKFHYTGPTGPDRTRTDPHGLCRRPARTQLSFAETRAAKKVRAGSVGSGRARVVEFSYNAVGKPRVRHPISTSIRPVL